MGQAKFADLTGIMDTSICNDFDNTFFLNAEERRKCILDEPTMYLINVLIMVFSGACACIDMFNFMLLIFMSREKFMPNELPDPDDLYLSPIEIFESDDMLMEHSL